MSERILHQIHEIEDSARDASASELAMLVDRLRRIALDVPAGDASTSRHLRLELRRVEGDLIEQQFDNVPV
ncbi:hypothetical protein [Qingshengfaniella alkalisoli]|uniref:Uncharacterized protein n=1 Tax=Qingshengfaniella alkalisoli TaxID=2599296 RepID=A0A5B8I5G7_9RHOB|nr:hypothetical protein [Qingshengfaniella alkalisoli]QDY68525.1 hypothetical protein FPZ52_02085 [Qingshengfaniella alkalisoli]